MQQHTQAATHEPVPAAAVTPQDQDAKLPMSPAPADLNAIDRPGAARGFSSSMNPISPKDWGFAQARHLLWRAGFGGTPAQINTLVKWGPVKSVDHLVNYESVPFDAVKADDFDKDIIRPYNREEQAELARARRSGDVEAETRVRAKRQEAERTDRRQMRDLQHWWLKRMIESARPLEEKMTLFWHGHFATNYRTIEDSYHMFMQNQMFRKHAVGNFGKMLYEVIRDPAMIAYLDNNDSRKGRPNENLAREIMELFSLGVGNYTEQDIKEGAKALTGYTFSDDEFEFQKNNHDTAVKVILGRKGALDGDDFVSAILERPACARHMTRKLYRFFAFDYPAGRREIDSVCQSAMSQLEGTLLSSRYEIKPVLRRLFLSEHFYQPEIMIDQIKSPTQLVVGAMRSLNTPARDLGVLNDAMNLMGQNIFYPPSVKGWDGGRSWINTATLFTRQNILCFMLTGKTPSGYDALAKNEKYDPSFLLGALDMGGAGANGDVASIPPDAAVDMLLRFCLGRSESYNRDVLLGLIQSRGNTLTPDTITQLLLLITAMPEYQLC